MKSFLLGTVLLFLGSYLTATAAECPPCGPSYCLGDPRYQQKLAKKKTSLLKEYPQRLVDLLEQDGKCIACIENSPDSFSILVVQNNGDQLEFTWTEDAERISNEQLQTKKITAYYLYNARNACACCNELKYDKRDDYISDLDLNKNLAIKCAYNNSTKNVECLHSPDTHLRK